MSAIPDQGLCKAELEAVIASGIFAKAPSLALLLDYVCSKFFEGQAIQIKEYNIAVEALGRPASFDPRQDSIVRVEAFRLRKRLKQYYANDGAAHPLRIVIPSGQYVPQFLENEQYAANGNGNGDGIFATADNNDIEEIPDTTPTVNSELDLITVEPLDHSQPPRRLERSQWIRRAIFLTLAAVAIASIVGVWYLRARSAVRTTSAVKPAAIAAGLESEEVRILCGSSTARYVDRAGNIWSSDRFFRGGSVFATPQHPLSGTADPELFRSRREGDFTYDVPLKPGVYELHLFFAETLFGENNTAGGGESSRVFRVSVNGKTALWSFDVIADAGGSNTADERVLKDISPASDGILHVQFSGLVNNVPFLNAMEIVPGIAGKMRPVRIVARPRNYVDQAGQVWAADRYYSHGSAVARSEPVSNTSDPEIFGAERFGNFVYTIPVAEGHYTVNLRFAETWFGPGKPGAGGEGSRLFDVYGNGVALLRSFDILRASGGPQRAIQKSFHGITPNAQGKIVLSFVPVVNYACINAIEVLDENN